MAASTGNTEQVTKGGRIVMKMVNKKQLYLLNRDIKCKGVFCDELSGPPELSGPTRRKAEIE